MASELCFLYFNIYWCHNLIANLRVSCLLIQWKYNLIVDQYKPPTEGKVVQPRLIYIPDHIFHELTTV